MFAFVRFLAGPLGVTLALGALGYGAYWVWGQLAGIVSGTGAPLPGGLPSLSLVAVGALLLIATIVVFRPGRPVDSAATLITKVALFAFAWLGMLAFTVGAYLT